MDFLKRAVKHIKQIRAIRGIMDIDRMNVVQKIQIHIHTVI